MDRLKFQMTTSEKIANAKKRIDELERLIKYWNISLKKNSNILNFPLEADNQVA